MTDAVQHTPLARLRGFSLRQLRLVSGMVLFSYLLSHFLNHALGNVSLAAMDWGLLLHLRFWHAPSVSLVFYSAAAIHTSLGIWALYERRQFHRATIEPLQLILGLSIPVLIVAHVVNMRLSGGLFGVVAALGVLAHLGAQRAVGVAVVGVALHAGGHAVLVHGGEQGAGVAFPDGGADRRHERRVGGADAPPSVGEVAPAGQDEERLHGETEQALFILSRW
eukprot:gene5055-6854_t